MENRIHVMFGMGIQTVLVRFVLFQGGVVERHEPRDIITEERYIISRRLALIVLYYQLANHQWTYRMHNRPHRESHKQANPQLARMQRKMQTSRTQVMTAIYGSSQ